MQCKDSENTVKLLPVATLVCTFSNTDERNNAKPQQNIVFGHRKSLAVCSALLWTYSA